MRSANAQCQFPDFSLKEYMFVVLLIDGYNFSVSLANGEITTHLAKFWTFLLRIQQIHFTLPEYLRQAVLHESYFSKKFILSEFQLTPSAVWIKLGTVLRSDRDLAAKKDEILPLKLFLVQRRNFLFVFLWTESNFLNAC
jgi:hypothetical protein